MKIRFHTRNRRRFIRRTKRVSNIKPGRQNYYSHAAEKRAFNRTLLKLKEQPALKPYQNTEPHCEGLVKRLVLKELRKEPVKYIYVFRKGQRLCRRPSSLKFLRELKGRHKTVYNTCLTYPLL